MGKSYKVNSDVARAETNCVNFARNNKASISELIFSKQSLKPSIFIEGSFFSIS